MKRIGMLTSGGDCQSLNAAMRGVVKGLSGFYKDFEIYGFQDGYKGLMYQNYKVMSPKDFSSMFLDALIYATISAISLLIICSSVCVTSSGI